jgi:vacuolar-type H+-ATPase subunit H
VHGSGPEDRDLLRSGRFAQRRPGAPLEPEPWEATGELRAEEVAGPGPEPPRMPAAPPDPWDAGMGDAGMGAPRAAEPGTGGEMQDLGAPDLGAPDLGTGNLGAEHPEGTTETEDLIGLAMELVAGARRAPLSTSVLVSREELLELLEQARRVLPAELREARYLLREREAFLLQQRQEGERILEEVRARAEQMVQRSEIVRQAEQQAQRILEAARQEARRLRMEAEDYCDERLAKLEVALERTLGTVRAGRQRLAGQRQGGSPGQAPAAGRAERRAATQEDEEDGLYDQDRG